MTKSQIKEKIIDSSRRNSPETILASNEDYISNQIALKMQNLKPKKQKKKPIPVDNNIEDIGIKIVDDISSIFEDLTDPFIPDSEDSTQRYQISKNDDLSDFHEDDPENMDSFINLPHMQNAHRLSDISDPNSPYPASPIDQSLRYYSWLRMNN